MSWRPGAAILTLTFALCVGAEANNNWPQFRGPGARGVADSLNLPETWSQTENVRWKTPIPGLGWSSPIVWGDTVFVTSVEPDGEIEAPQPGLYRGGERPTSTLVHHWKVYAVDLATGALRWEREVHSGVPAYAHHLKNTYASETPVTDGERVYVYFGNVGLYCFDVKGTLLWSQEVPVRETRNGWGKAASPVLHRGRLYIVNDNDEQSYLAGYSAETGAELWRTARDEGTNWATPYIWENSARTEIVTSGTDKVRSYDLDGTLLWELSGMSTITIPTPFAEGDLLYITSGYVGDQLRPVYAIRAGGSGDVSLKRGETANDFIAWHLPQGGPYNPSPLLYKGVYYTLLDRGFFTAHDAQTGREIYPRQRISVGAGFTASPWAYADRIFVLSEEGDTYVIQAGPDFAVLGKNSLGEFSMATPAIVGDSLIIRTARHLYRIGGSR